MQACRLPDVGNWRCTCRATVSLCAKHCECSVQTQTQASCGLQVIWAQKCTFGNKAFLPMLLPSAIMQA